MTRARITVSFIVMLVICAIALMGAFIPSSVAYAAGTAYSDVLDDLHTDESFSEENYPVVADDYSLKVIQVAESVDNELFVYVYQPSGFVKPLKASSINISLVPRENISDVKNYKLRLLNSDGVFFKYLVEGLTVGTATTRYYTIPSIFRPYDETIDEGADHGNEITEVVYEVAKEYCFSTINGEPFCRVLDIETIEITDKFVGFVRYSNGFELNEWRTSCDSHFVAFNTDRDIDRLLEADVYYTSQSYEWNRRTDWMNPKETFGEKEDNYAYLTYEQKVDHTGDGWWAPTYTWNRIETVENFIANEDIEQTVYTGALINVSVANKITDEGKAALEGKQWILRFSETEYGTENGALGTMYQSSTIVGDVTILRLKFETDGVTYNLGVVDNKQSGDPDNPINEEEIKAEPTDIMKLIMLIIGIVFIVVLLVIIAPILPYIIKFVIWLICLPFRAIAKLIDAAKKPKETGTVQNARKKKPVKTVSQTKRK
ncbi:MAG TPA: hypothetical protein IAC16_04825 [Candidatus Limadaptatus stercoravium]|nr:hypothetical protein [Candidatus Limadaptatus stercoravium]